MTTPAHVVPDAATKTVGAGRTPPGALQAETPPSRPSKEARPPLPVAAIGGRGREIATTDGEETVAKRRERRAAGCRAGADRVPARVPDAAPSGGFVVAAVPHLPENTPSLTRASFQTRDGRECGAAPREGIGQRQRQKEPVIDAEPKPSF